MSIFENENDMIQYRNYILVQSNMIVSYQKFIDNLDRYHHLQDIVTSWGQELWGVFSSEHYPTETDSIVPCGQKIDVRSKKEYKTAVQLAKQAGVHWYAVMADEHRSDNF